MNILSKVKSFLNSANPLGTFGFSWSNAPAWTKEQQLDQYVRYVHSIVSAISEDVAKIDFIAQRKVKGKWNTLDSHPIIDLLNRPNNPYKHSKFQLIELYETFMELTGECFWYTLPRKGSHQPTILMPLRPDRIDVAIADDDLGTILGYVFNAPDGSKVPLETWEIIHHKLPNPKNMYRGKGIVEAAADYIQTEEYATGWTKNTIYNSGRPSGIVALKGTIQPSEFQKIKRQFQQEYSGTKNAGKTMFVNADAITFQKIGAELGDIGLVEIRNATRDDIMTMFRISKTMLGITDDVNFSNSKTAKTVWLENVIKNKMFRLCDQLTMTASEIYKENPSDFRVFFTDPNPETLDEKQKEWSSGFNKWLTINDIRRERGLEPIEGGDVIYQGFNLVPTQELASFSKSNQNGDNNQQQKKIEHKHIHEKSEVIEKSPACRMDDESKSECIARKIPEIMAENPKMTQDQAIAIAESLCSKSCSDKKSEKKNELRSAEIQEKGELFRTNLFKGQSRWELVYKRTMNKVFESQLLEIQENNREIKSKQKASVNWYFDKNKSRSLALNLLFPVTEELMTEQSKQAFAIAGNPDETLVISDQIKNFINDRISRFIDETDNETFGLIDQAVAEGLANGESNRKIIKRIEELFSQAEQYRSARIARTETIAASNQSALEAYRQSPLVTAQEWFTEPDACEFCASLNGKIVGLDSNFLVNGQTLEGTDGGQLVVDYVDVNHPPLHPNCKCTILPVQKEI